MTRYGERTSQAPWIIFGTLLVASVALLVWSLAATPSPGLPPERVALFHNEGTAWLGAIGILIAVTGALIAVNARRSRDQRIWRDAVAEASRLEERARELEVQLQRRDEMVQEATAALEEARHRIDEQTAAAERLRSANQELELERREHDLRVRELELRIGEIELERDRQRPFQQAG